MKTKISKSYIFIFLIAVVLLLLSSYTSYKYGYRKGYSFGYDIGEHEGIKKGKTMKLYEDFQLWKDQFDEYDKSKEKNSN